MIVKEGDAVLLDENWAIETGRIREFFRCQEDIVESQNDFYYGNCRITLIPLPTAQESIFAVSRTRIQMDGPEDEVKKIHRRFFLRFLSAGG